MASERSTSSSQRSRLASIPSTHFSARSREAFARISIDCEQVVGDQRHHHVQLEVARTCRRG